MLHFRVGSMAKYKCYDKENISSEEKPFGEKSTLVELFSNWLEVGNKNTEYFGIFIYFSK